LQSDLTIIIPNWNGFPYLKDCIASIKSAQYEGKKEIVIVDNASTDGSREWMEKENPEVKIIKNSENKGFAFACNQGAEKASGKYIIFLNTDMKIASDFLTQISNIDESHKNIASVSAKIMDWNGERTLFAGGTVNYYGHGFQEEKSPEESPQTEGEEIRELLFSCGGASLFDKRIFLDSGGFDTDYFAYFEDIDLGIRLNSMDYKILYNPKAVTYHVGEASSKNLPTKLKHMLYERNALYTIIKNYSDGTLSKILAAALLLAFARVSSSLEDTGDAQPKLSFYGLATIEAVNEVIKNLDRLLEKRKTIQEKRKVEDDIILRKFGCFLKTNLYDAEYYTKLLKVTECFAVEKLFRTEVGKDAFRAIFDDFTSLLDVTMKKNHALLKEIISLNKAIAEKDLYIQRLNDNITGLENKIKDKETVLKDLKTAIMEKDRYINEQNEILDELREYIREKDRQIKKLREEIEVKEQFLKTKDHLIQEKEKEIEALNSHIKAQEQAHEEFAKRQLDILTTLRNRLKNQK